MGECNTKTGTTLAADQHTVAAKVSREGLAAGTGGGKEEVEDRGGTLNSLCASFRPSHAIGQNTRVGKRVSVRARILEHIRAIHDINAYTGDFRSTQNGIAEALGITRAHASIELHHLELDGAIRYALKVIPNHRQRIRCYYIEPRGKKIRMSFTPTEAREIYSHCKRIEQIIVRGQDR